MAAINVDVTERCVIDIDGTDYEHHVLRPLKCIDSLLLGLTPVTPVTGRPEPIFPDVRKERMFEMDGITLAALKPFEKKDLSPSPSLSLEKPGFQQSSSTPLYRRRKTLSPSALNIRSPGSSSPMAPKATIASIRRQSAPILRLNSPRVSSGGVRTNSLVSPIRLSRPSEPFKSPSGTEIWWPGSSKGGIKVYVYISSWASAYPERLMRTFDLPQVYAAAKGSGLGEGEAQCSESIISFPTPGTILPVPGDSPTQAIAPRRRFSSVSPYTPTTSAFVSGRKTYHNEYLAQAVGKSSILVSQRVSFVFLFSILTIFR